MWAQYFSSIVVVSPKISLEQAKRDQTTFWVPVSTIPSISRIEFVPLPLTHSPFLFLKEIFKVRQMLIPYIQRSKYLHFTIGGFLGDWGTVAALQAYFLKKPYSVHMDWIAHKVMKHTLDSNSSFLRREKRKLHSLLTYYWNNKAISKAYAALCNGKTCYDYYKLINQNAFKIYNIHLNSEDIPNFSIIQDKKERAKSTSKLSICYTGRMDPMKAPIDWLNVIGHVRDLGVNIQATWYGNGPLWNEFQQRVHLLKLGDIVQTPGFITDRKSLMRHVECADLFLMTHISEESPRCIIESIMKGTPVLGYESAFAEDVLQNSWALSAIGDWKSLGEKIALIDKDRNNLVNLIEHSEIRGKDFDEQKAFEYRSNLIKDNYPQS